MPQKKGYKKRPFNRKRNYRKSNIGRPPVKALAAPKPYYFKRSFVGVQSLTANNAYWTKSADNKNLGRTWGFSLNDSLGNSATEFSSLFKYYKIVGARVRMYFSNTGSNATSGENPAVSPTVPNCQILVTIDRNQDGDPAAVADDELYLQSQTAKRMLALRTDGKPLDIYMPLQQANFVQAVEGDPPASVVRKSLIKPKFVSTQDAGHVAHYGFNMMLQRVDGEGFTAGMENSQKVRILTTLYFQCKKVE